MNGMHGIIFSYEKRNDLRELEEIRSASSVPFGGRYRAVDFSCPIWSMPVSPTSVSCSTATIRACWTTLAPARTGT